MPTNEQKKGNSENETMQGREYNYRNLDCSQRHKMVHNEKKVLLKKIANKMCSRLFRR